jgi:hypothetical protein
VGKEVIIYWLNRSPLFADHPITLFKARTIISILNLILGDPSSNQREHQLRIQAPQSQPSLESLGSNLMKKRQVTSWSA